MKTELPALPFDRIRLGGIAGHYRCPRDWRWDVRMDDHDLWIALQGRGELVIDGRRIVVTAPQAVVFRPGEAVRGRHDPDAPLEVIALHFTPVKLIGGEDWTDRVRSVRLRSAGFFREAGEQLVAEHARGDAAGRQAAEALGLALLGAVWRLALTPDETPGDDRLEKLVRRVQREPERAWTIALLAREAGLGATRLNRAFRRITGSAPMTWVIRCRLARATWLLQETNLKLAEIADACGYRDVYFFARQFRRFMGKPPGAWRKG